MKKEPLESIGRWISVLYRQFQIYINKALKEYNLNSSEYIYLIHLDDQDGVNQKYLSDKIGIDDALTTRAMKSLESKGYITRVKNIKDRRAYQINITQEGRNLVPLIEKVLKEWTLILSQDMTSEDVHELITTLHHMSSKAIEKNQSFSDNKSL